MKMILNCKTKIHPSGDDDSEIIFARQEEKATDVRVVQTTDSDKGKTDDTNPSNLTLQDLMANEQLRNVFNQSLDERMDQEHAKLLGECSNSNLVTTTKSNVEKVITSKFTVHQTKLLSLV